MKEKTGTIRKQYYVKPYHIAVLNQVAKDHGESGPSAALRFIINDWVGRVSAGSIVDDRITKED